LPRWFKQASLNFALTLGTIAVCYLVLEFIFFRIVLIHWPPGMRIYLPETSDVLAQNSKTGLLPRDYLAILGDSNAKGVGDWLLEAGNDRSAPFHSANILHDRLRRDVASFGMSNAGSAEALVRMPTRILEGSRCYLFPDIEDPKELVVYVYEGNDVRDNLIFLDRVKAAYGADGAAEIDRYLNEVYAVFPHWRCHLHFGDVVNRAFRLYWYRPFDRLRELPTRTNPFLSNGKVERAPRLEGPPESHTNEQVIRAVEVYERSLTWLRRRFPGIPITVFFVPSQITIYLFVNENIDFYHRNADNSRITHPTSLARIARFGTFMCDHIRQATLRHDARFFDTRAGLRKAGATKIMHGPVDWDHFNRVGYTVLGNLVADSLTGSGELQAGTCMPAPGGSEGSRD
jgi:hypothetical protein